jgi:hypothetical protein
MGGFGELHPHRSHHTIGRRWCNPGAGAIIVQHARKIPGQPKEPRQFLVYVHGG